MQNAFVLIFILIVRFFVGAKLLNLKVSCNRLIFSRDKLKNIEFITA